MGLGQEFKGLPMESLIGAPLTAACESNLQLAKATAEFIETVGFEKDKDGNSQIRTANFAYNAQNEKGEQQKVNIDVPLLSVVQIPSLKVDLVDITFDMEIKTSEESKEEKTTNAKYSVEGSAGWGPFKVKASVSGSVSAHKENTRKTDNSAKYHVQVKASDHGMPEGLARVLDLMNNSIVATTKQEQLTTTPNKQPKS